MLPSRLYFSPKYLLLAPMLALFLVTVSASPRLTPAACAACDPATCCNCQNAWTDADNDGFTVGGAVSVCFDPGAPSGYRNATSAQPDCNDSNALIGYQPAQTCPTNCGYPGGTVPDGNCGFTTCPSIPAPPSFGQTCSACNSCGSCNTGTIGCDGACSVSAPAGGTLTTYYRDADGDGYGNPSVTIQSCATTPPSGYVANGSDCYDSNADAHPGQGTYFNVTRGDGSFDYNCDGVGNYASGAAGPAVTIYEPEWSSFGPAPSYYGRDEYGKTILTAGPLYVPRSSSGSVRSVSWTPCSCTGSTGITPAGTTYWMNQGYGGGICGGTGYTSASDPVSAYWQAYYYLFNCCSGAGNCCQAWMNLGPVTETDYLTPSGPIPVYCH